MAELEQTSGILGTVELWEASWAELLVEDLWEAFWAELLVELLEELQEELQAEDLWAISWAELLAGRGAGTCSAACWAGRGAGRGLTRCPPSPRRSSSSSWRP